MGVILFHGINVRDSASILLPGSSELGVRVFCSFLVSFLVHIVFLLVKLNSPTICWALCSRGSALRLSIFCCAEPAVKQFFFFYAGLIVVRSLFHCQSAMKRSCGHLPLPEH